MKSVKVEVLLPCLFNIAGDTYMKWPRTIALTFLVEVADDLSGRALHEVAMTTARTLIIDKLQRLLE